MNEEIMGKGPEPWDNNSAVIDWILEELNDKTDSGDQVYTQNMTDVEKVNCL